MPCSTKQHSVTTTRTALKAHGPRTVVTLEEACALRLEWLDQLQKLQSSSLSSSSPTNDTEAAVVAALDLGGRAWKVNVLNALDDVFQQIQSTVQQLLLDDIIASLDTDTGLETLEYLAQTFANAPHLEEVNLSDNAVGIRGLNMLLPLFHVNNVSDEETKDKVKGGDTGAGGRSSTAIVKKWSFYNCGMSEEVALVLKDVLLPHAPTLTVLNLGRNQIGPMGAQHMRTLLQQAHQLEVFEYAGSRPLKVGTKHLCQGLLDAAMAASNADHTGGTNHRYPLRVLDLNDSILGDGSDDDDPVFLLCQLLRVCPQLQTLIVKDGGLDGDGLALVLDALLDDDGNGAAPGKQSLTHLDVGALCIGTDGADKLAECLPQMTQLTHLFLETNALEDEGAKTVLEALTSMSEEGSCQLELLDLSDNELTEDILQTLLDNRVSSLKTLVLKDNNDLDDAPEELLQQLMALYDTVVLHEDDHHHHHEHTTTTTSTITTTTASMPTETASSAASSLDALANAMGQTHL